MLLKTNPYYTKLISQKEALIATITASLRNYLESNCYPTEVVNEIVSEEFIAANPSYYVYYPYLFKDYFQIDDTETLDMLSIAGFLYYRAVILIDRIFDDKNSKHNFKKYFIANICQEETIKILSRFFGENPKFWKTWNLRKFEYAKAYKLDKTLKSINDISEFEALADYKSAFGKIAIDCLFQLSNKKDKELYTSLLASHKYFYVAFQIFDDIKDYTEDVENEQFNISKYELILKLQTENDSIDSYTIAEQKKLIYLKGIAENLYEKATNYLDKSIALQADFSSQNTQLWTNEIDGLYNTGITHFLNIKGFISMFNSQQKLSLESHSNTTIQEAVESADSFLKNSQISDGSWNDILNDAGVSDVWATCFVTQTLSEFNMESAEAIAYIQKHQLASKLWSYNKIWLEDADSSSFALLSLSKQEIPTEEAFNQWLMFQNKDGGFATYNDKNILISSLNSPNIKNVNGWLQSHFCVSAVAFLVCVELEKTETLAFQNLRTYLLNQLSSKKHLLSYWWTTDAYALYYVLLAAIKTNDTEIIRLSEIRTEIELKRTVKTTNYFYKSYLLKTVCLRANLLKKHRAEIDNIALQIISNQFADGSWKGNYSLKMPHPSVVNTARKDIQWKPGNKGTNCIVKDFNRVFTTVSCLSALKNYGASLS
ncbi:MAG: hypothetical protein AB8B65_20205 [Kordia sp.]|uniref:hypothetical protein n=1 Tax=Kordia sp. TaxID=1965332 RepID=UPI003857F90C